MLADRAGRNALQPLQAVVERHAPARRRTDRASSCRPSGTRCIPRTVPSWRIVTSTPSTAPSSRTTSLTLTGEPDAKSTVARAPAAFTSARNPSTASSTYMKSIRFSPLPRTTNSRWPAAIAVQPARRDLARRLVRAVGAEEADVDVAADACRGARRRTAGTAPTRASRSRTAAAATPASPATPAPLQAVVDRARRHVDDVIGRAVLEEGDERERVRFEIPARAARPRPPDRRWRRDTASRPACRRSAAPARCTSAAFSRSQRTGAHVGQAVRSTNASRPGVE